VLGFSLPDATTVKAGHAARKGMFSGVSYYDGLWPGLIGGVDWPIGGTGVWHPVSTPVGLG
jgi:hypothetical protein